MSDLNTDYKAFVAKLFNRTGDLSKDFSHAVFGIVTEVDEMFKAQDDKHAREEKGDLMFFVRALILVSNEASGVDTERVTIDQYPDVTQKVLGSSNPQQSLNDLMIDLMDAAKRWVGYGKIPADFSLLVFKAQLATGIALSVCRFQGDTPEDVVKTNMAKLLVRYPGGEFDAYRAVERDLEAERVVLEKP